MVWETLGYVLGKQNINLFYLHLRTRINVQKWFGGLRKGALVTNAYGLEK